MSEEKQPHTIRELYGMKPRTEGVGIEVEVEAKSPLPSEIGGVWLVKTDDSLRDHAYEYVCRQPIKVGPEKISHIKVLTDKLNTADIKLSMSNRTSVHVHRNVQEFTPVQVWTALIAYWMIEDPLMNYCGESRKGNLFCLPLSQSEGILDTCMEDLESKKLPFSSFSKQKCKYGGQNLATINTYGSIEYRAMRGTTDPELIDKWSSLVYTLSDRAKIFKDPSVLMDYYLDSSKDELLNALLGEYADIVKDTPNYIGLIRDNVMRLCDLAYAQDDWMKWQLQFKPVVKKTSPFPHLNEDSIVETNWAWNIPIAGNTMTATILDDFE
jgi:hypothetical protein